MNARMLALPVVLGLLGSFAACNGDDGGDVGAPCNVASDCASGLVCDVHDGQGSCQEPHGHESGEETAHGETEHGETDHHATGHDSGSGGHDSGESGHHHDSGETGHHDSSGSGSDTGSGTGG